ncbi:MAG: hypothetical protein MSH49_07310 [[Eubacterium] saphenum]|nr:hypothetical protein [[Eubacterium] saphenum]
MSSGAEPFDSTGRNRVSGGKETRFLDNAAVDEHAEPQEYRSPRGRYLDRLTSWRIVAVSCNERRSFNAVSTFSATGISAV